MHRLLFSPLAILALSAGAFGQPRSTGKWLVDLGRDYPLSPQAGLSDADAEITLLFMEAASRVEPDLAEAYRWQYDMLTALEREAEARESLARYVRLMPADISAHLQLVALTVDVHQTAEVRADACRTLLEEGNLPKPVTSDLHRRLAEYYYNRGEEDRVRSEAESALADYPFNFAARRLLNAVSAGEQTAVDRVRFCLSVLECSPASAEVAWQLGNELRELGLGVEADRWYKHAIDMYGLIPPGKAPPELLADQAAAVATTRPAEADDVQGLLKAFPRQVLDYPSRPDKYLSLSLHGLAPEMPPGAPWRCTFILRNIGTFPICFGQNMMVVPEVLCEIQARGDQVRTSGPTLRVSLHRQLRLMPGESIEVSQTLDVGAIRSAMIGTPQRAHDVTVTAVLSPIALQTTEGQEVWTAGPGGLMARPLSFRRTSFIPSDEQFNLLVARTRSGDMRKRIETTERLAMLLGEHQHLAAGRLDYPHRPIDADAARAAIFDRVNDPDWPVRAHLAESLRWFALDKWATQKALPLRRDSHWLVRGLALRTLTDHHGEKMRPMLQTHIDTDPDEWVRRFAAALMARMEPETQPANSPE
jgi:tetratricopeptide (TPR) repeat protein